MKDCGNGEKDELASGAGWTKDDVVFVIESGLLDCAADDAVAEAVGDVRP
jgi:hypothetical protein